MSISPLDIHHKEFRRSVRGYHRGDVDEFLDDIVKELDGLLRENETLKEHSQEMSARLDQYRQIEETLQKTLVLAQETAEDVRSNARQEAQRVIAEAKMEGRRIEDEANRNVDGLHSEAERLRLQLIEFLSRTRANLRAQLELLEATQREFAAGESASHIDEE